jgi:phage tail-like protein
MSPLDGLWGWHQDVSAGVIQRRNGTIYLLNKEQVPVLQWNFREAFPVKWTGPALNAASSAVAFESIELAHRGLARARRVTAESAVAFATDELAKAATLEGFF